MFEISFLKRAIFHLKRGGIIAYPTEAVFGLGCDPDNEGALLNLISLKSRPKEKGFVIIAYNLEQISNYACLELLDSKQINQLLCDWPGPKTWILDAKDSVSPIITGNTNTIAVRITAHPVASKICKMYGKPIVSTSANTSGNLPCKSWQEVKKVFCNSVFVVKGKTQGRPNPCPIWNIQTGKCIREG